MELHFLSDNLFWLVPAFFAIAVLYSSAGFGGGTGYLSMMVITDVDQSIVRWVSYMCNITVTGFSGVRYGFRKVLTFNEIWPWVLGSVPLAFVGGQLKLADRLYFILLGILLLMAAMLLLFQKRKREIRVNGVFNTLVGQFSLGAVIGLLSGMVGVGGGIFLSPILHLVGWKTPQKIAALSTFFIFVNALSGAIAFATRNAFQVPIYDAGILMAAVLFGAVIGTNFSLSEKGKKRIRSITGVLVAIVAFRLLWQHLG
ncbi:MAG: TSUP family transporter [Cryomorphaceae bacterium]|nr:TSUP family transporter [Cryomorphaceae bacterium]